MRLTPVLIAAGAGALCASASANAHSQPHDQSPAHLHDKRTLGIHLPGPDISLGGRSRRPSASWRCDGSGKDGYSVDWLGLGRPFWVPQGWLYFGTSIGWAPPAGWECSASWSIPSLFLNIVHEVTWWKPSDAWLGAHDGVDIGFTAPSWWGVILRPSRGWTCDGSGKDGWSVDWEGNGRPSWAPEGWLWFGSSIGWAPSAGWSCDASWSLPSAFKDTCVSVSWWKPSQPWIDAHVGADLGFTLPSWWNVILRPTRGWTCDGFGKDGWSVDWEGNGRPSWAPEGWLWFGGSIGWAPPPAWSCSSSWRIPTQWSSVWRVTWWQPGDAWLAYHREHDFGWSVPSWWGLDSCGCSCDCGAKTLPVTSSIVVSTTSRAPSTSTRPAPTTTSRAIVSTPGTSKTKETTSSPALHSTSSTQPAVTTTQRASTTSRAPSTTSRARTTSRSAASTPGSSGPGTTSSSVAAGTTRVPSTTSHKTSSTKKASTTSKKPSAETPVCAMPTSEPATRTVTVTAPAQVVTVTEAHNLTSPPKPTDRPSHDGEGESEDGSDEDRPGRDWECSGSGDDGKDVDWQGNGCPSHLPSGWKWWGVSIGWGPAKGWKCGSNWKPKPIEVDSCSKTHWWKPPPSLQLPPGVECPAGWTSSGWIDHRKPSSSWNCDGSGRDGFDFDHRGNGRPADLPVGWKWFGQRYGWQPCSSFQLPSSSWSPPSEWNPSVATWWQPGGTWNLRGNFRCPRWWNRGHLRGQYRWW
ncbi:proteophosphoglycan ppg4 [Rhodotorula toruloides]|uniref:Proteophosphoglycan ppg4 n=1 Tax=Rhodotorula toruloides TaxID=5286 RepID=A0A511KFI7_RHOTO|nr:proteophosphoglycan ppg4 [Rhodotorula toruloides]